MSDEQRERMLIAEQIERAAADAEVPSSKDSPPVEEGLKRDEATEKVVLSFDTKLAASTTPSSSTPPVGFKNPLKLNANPLKANPLKRPNVFKSAIPNTDAEKVNEKKRAAPMTAAERLIIEEQERKRRRMDRESV